MYYYNIYRNSECFKTAEVSDLAFWKNLESMLLRKIDNANGQLDLNSDTVKLLFSYDTPKRFFTLEG